MRCELTKLHYHEEMGDEWLREQNGVPLGQQFGRLHYHKGMRKSVEGNFLW